MSAAKLSPNKLESQRRGLLAKAHIAQQQLLLSREEYERELVALFGCSSAKALSIAELQRLVKHFQGMGYVPTAPRRPADQSAALRARLYGEAERMANGRERLRGLVRSHTGMSDLRFVRDVDALRRLLSAMAKIRDEYPAALGAPPRPSPRVGREVGGTGDKAPPRPSPMVGREVGGTWN